jgi:hypothetical protein
MRTIADIAALIAEGPKMMRLLAAVEQQNLPDAWIGAGFIRNAVWDALSGITDAAMHGDVDVIYFDRADAGAECDADIEARLRRDCFDAPWSVKNQARMHVRNGDLPYRDGFDAVAHWPETATAIAARTIGGRVEVLAPYGVDDLIGLIVRPTPAFTGKLDVYRARMRQKSWQARWPELRVLALD